MAAYPDVLPIPGAVVRSVLLLLLNSNAVWGESVTVSPFLYCHKNKSKLTAATPNTDEK